jgi:Ran GTPase-activating protein (RanGAP) involved in mRNA processing and transport
MSKDIKGYKQKREDLINQIKQLTDTNSFLKDDSLNLKNYNTDLSIKITLLEKSLEEYKDIIFKDGLKIKNLNHQLEQNKDSSKEINIVFDENILLKKEIELFKRRLKEGSLHIKAKEDEIELKEDELKLAQAETAKKEKLITHLEDNLEHLKDKLKNRESEQATFKNTVTVVDRYAITKELLIDQLFLLYLYDHSISLQNVVEAVLNNFGLFMNTVFLRNGNYFMSASILHEFIEDLYFKIYETYIDAKKVSSFEINQEDINIEIKKRIAREIFENNMIFKIHKFMKKDNHIDDLISNFVNNYEKSFDLGEVKLATFIDKEVRCKVIDKIEKYKSNVIEQIESLVEYSIINLYQGKIIYKNKEIYNFKNYFNGKKFKELKQKHTIYINDNISDIEALDGLVYTLKYESSELQNVYLQSNFDTSKKYPLAKTVFGIMLYCPDISYLALTDSNLCGLQLEYIIKLLECNKSLKDLDLSKNYLSDDGLRCICEHLRENKSITAVKFNNNNLRSNSGFYLADLFVKNNTIETISLEKNDINDTGLSSFMSILAYNNKTLKSLNLSSNGLGENDYIPISELISNNTTLKYLNISNNLLDSKSANYIGLALKNSKLSVLVLKNMNLDEESFPLLIKNNNENKLEELYLDNNNIGDVTVFLANMLRMNTYLHVLSLKACNINSIFLICLCRSLEVNKSLEMINLEDNELDEATLLILKKTLADKNLKIIMSANKLKPSSRDIFKEIDNILII